ncbi:MAG TPA: outer membrane beta-barrel domain-containing protein [Polyangia bacterium]
MRRNLYIGLALATLTLVGAAPARAGDDLDEEQVATYAVQSRLFRLGGELAVDGGILPINAFSKGLTVGGAFTYHFSNSWAWEIINANYVYKQLDTGLKTELLENFNVQPTDISSIDLMLSSSLVLKPFYGKLALFNRRVIHMELSIPIGVVMGRYTNPQAYLPGPTSGLLFHVFLSPHTSVRVDVRENVLFNHWHMRHELHVSLGLSLAWGGDER